MFCVWFCGLIASIDVGDVGLASPYGLFETSVVAELRGIFSPDRAISRDCQLYAGIAAEV